MPQNPIQLRKDNGFSDTFAQRNLAKALKFGWPVKPELKEQIVHDTENIIRDSETSVRDKNIAIRNLIMMNGQNVQLIKEFIPKQHIHSDTIVV